MSCLSKLKREKAFTRLVITIISLATTRLIWFIDFTVIKITFGGQIGSSDLEGCPFLSRIELRYIAFELLTKNSAYFQDVDQSAALEYCRFGEMEANISELKSDSWLETAQSMAGPGRVHGEVLLGKTIKFPLCISVVVATNVWVNPYQYYRSESLLCVCFFFTPKRRNGSWWIWQGGS